MELLSTAFQYLLFSLEHLGWLAYVVLFVITLADSLIILGTFTTGSAFLFLAGWLTSRDVYDLTGMVLASGLGAMIGGLLSYRLGRLESTFLRTSRIAPRERSLERASKLFARHGGIGLLLGRFLGPIGSVMSFIAGTSRMPVRRFILWNLAAAFTWSCAFIFLGILFGDSLSTFRAL